MNKLAKLSLIKQQKAFTLLELTIVISIVFILISLVGPMTINSFEKTEAKIEFKTLKNWLKSVSYQSYIQGTELQLTLDGKQAKLTNQNETVKEHTFNYLFFQPQKVVFNDKGFVYEAKIEMTFKGKPTFINLQEHINQSITKSGL